jgi:hypothetical protein
MADFPERLRIRFVGGATYDALRHWSVGNRLGLEFLGSQIDDADSLRLRAAARQALKTQGVHAAVRMLQAADFLKSGDMREAAEAAEIAMERFSELLD